LNFCAFQPAHRKPGAWLKSASAHTPNDVETFGDTQVPFLSTIVGANPALAQSPICWRRSAAEPFSPILPILD
jgi:hypothetical protein